jgi:hypothetical protein
VRVCPLCPLLPLLLLHLTLHQTHPNLCFPTPLPCYSSHSSGCHGALVAGAVPGDPGVPCQLRLGQDHSPCLWALGPLQSSPSFCAAWMQPSPSGTSPPKASPGTADHHTRLLQPESCPDPCVQQVVTALPEHRDVESSGQLSLLPALYLVSSLSLCLCRSLLHTHAHH